MKKKISNIEIRKVKINDEKALYSLFKSLSYTDKKYFHPFPFTMKSCIELVNKSLHGKDKYFVMLDNSKIVGYAHLRGLDEGYDIPFLGVVIHPNYRRRNFGILLCDFVIKESLCNKIGLKVHKNNKSAMKFYLKLGFKTEKCDGESLYMYTKKPVTKKVGSQLQKNVSMKVKSVLMK